MNEVFNGAQLGLAMQLISLGSIVQFQAARGEDVSGREAKMASVADFLETLSDSIRNAEGERKQKLLEAKREQEQARIEESREHVRMLTAQKTEAVQTLEDEIKSIVALIPESERTSREAKLAGR